MKDIEDLSAFVGHPHAVAITVINKGLDARMDLLVQFSQDAVIHTFLLLDGVFERIRQSAIVHLGQRTVEFGGSGGG